jgi:serine/threonine-protein kinase RsbT
VTFPPADADLFSEVRLATEKDVALARRAAFNAMDRAGARTALRTRFVTAVSEIARNTVVHGGGGQMRVFIGGTTVYVLCSDNGPGIADVSRALEDGFTTGTSLGRGLGGARRLVARFDIESSERGTTVRMASH